MAQVIPHFRKPWQLLVSVCLTRMNVITKELSDLEHRYAVMQNELELEQSVYNDHEFRMRYLQIIDAEKMQILTEEREKVVLDASRELAGMEDLEEEWSNDLNKVVVASRNTKYDGLDNHNILDRRLDDILHCVVKDDTLLLENTSLYPYTTLESDETLITASERLLHLHGLSTDVTFFSNAPVGVLKLRYNESEERGAVYQGAKLFFMKAQLKQSSQISNEAIEWLTINELGECTNEDYFRKVQTFVS